MTTTTLTFAERHPYVVLDANGDYDSRFSNIEAAFEIGGTSGGWLPVPLEHEAVAG